MTDKTYLGKTADGSTVYVDTESSHAATHFDDNPKLLEAVKNVIPTLELNNELVRIDVDTGKEVGTTDLVETNQTDEIVYALRLHRDRYSRFVKGKNPTSSTWITLDFRQTNENEYDLYTAFIGRLTPSFPGGDYLPEQSEEFWSKHALVYGSQEIVPGTETTECPW